MENTQNLVNHEEEEYAKIIQQAIFDMHSQIGMKEEETDRKNDEK